MYKHMHGPEDGQGGEVFVADVSVVGGRGPGPSPSCPAWSPGDFDV